MHLTTDKFNPFTKKRENFTRKYLCEKYEKNLKLKG